eukprot:gene2857-1842_t
MPDTFDLQKTKAQAYIILTPTNKLPKTNTTPERSTPEVHRITKPNSKSHKLLNTHSPQHIKNNPARKSQIQQIYKSQAPKVPNKHTAVSKTPKIPRFKHSVNTILYYRGTRTPVHTTNTL